MWGGDYVTPNVSFIEHTSTQEEQQVRFQPYIPPPPPYLTFTAQEDDCEVGFVFITNGYEFLDGKTAPEIQYSTDNGTSWHDYNFTVFNDVVYDINDINPILIILVNAGDTVMFRGVNETLSIYENDYDDVMTFRTVIKGTVAASGDVTSLLNGEGGNVSLTDYCFSDMFKDCTGLTQAPELPAMTLASNCYYYMFYGCTGLTAAPSLPATTLAENCYSSMFQGCTSLTQAPELPATTLANYCYSGMFYRCTSLTQAPALPATTLTSQCYENMFQGCTSLTQAPELPAFTMSPNCYRYMFYGCTSLTQAPELPATTLANYCYYSMFQYCTSLTQAPVLRAKTLVNNCYTSMFSDCTKLNYIKAMFTSTPSSSYTSNWLRNVASSGTFVKNASATWNVTGNNGIPSGWTVETAAA